MTEDGNGQCGSWMWTEKTEKRWGWMLEMSMDRRSWKEEGKKGGERRFEAGDSRPVTNDSLSQLASTHAYKLSLSLLPPSLFIFTLSLPSTPSSCPPDNLLSSSLSLFWYKGTFTLHNKKKPRERERGSNVSRVRFVLTRFFFLWKSNRPKISFHAIFVSNVSLAPPSPPPSISSLSLSLFLTDSFLLVLLYLRTFFSFRSLESDLFLKVCLFNQLSQSAKAS